MPPILLGPLLNAVVGLNPAPPSAWHASVSLNATASSRASPRSSADVDAVAGFTLAVAKPEAVLARAQEAGLALIGQGFTLMGVELSIESV